MKLQDKNVLVTGGAGFIPSFVVEALVERGARVTAIDNLKFGRMQNLANVRRDVRFQKIDLRDFVRIKNIVRGQEVIFHLGANADVPYSVEHPDYDFETNTVGTYHILQAALKHNVQKVIFASSAAVYGEPIYVPMDEKHLLKPISPYGASKLAAESLGFAYDHTFGLQFTALRVFNTYGPRQPRYVMFDFMRKLLENPDRFEVLGTGEQVRDYCFVTDTAEAFVRAAELDVAGEAINIAGGNPISIKDLAQKMVEDLGFKGRTKIVYTGKSWKGDIQRLIADIGKIQKLLDFRPSVSFDEGIHALEEWYKRAHKP